MTNAAFKAMINEYGDRICIIVFDNNVKVYIGYPSSTLQTVNDIQFKTFGDVDMIGIPKQVANPKLAREGVTTTIWHPTDCVQMVATLDAGYERYRIDPMEIG